MLQKTGVVNQPNPEMERGWVTLMGWTQMGQEATRHPGSHFALASQVPSYRKGW